MDECFCQLNSERNQVKYCTDVHGLLRKQEVSDLELLWLLLFDPVGAYQLTDSLFGWSCLTF